MEFLRFGSSIPGGYWGCCACCIIQDFNQDPDDKANIQLVSGDSGTPLWKGGGKELAFAGPTYRDIFNTRLRIGTFNLADKPNHAFLAILTSSQCSSPIGKKWLAILKEAGFEFIRAFDNSVYTGASIIGAKVSPHPNYLFGLFRNIGPGALDDPMTPPEAWNELPEQTKTQTELWEASSPTVVMSQSEIEKSGQEPILAGRRSVFPPQTKKVRDEIEEHLSKGGTVTVEGSRSNTRLIPLPIPIPKEQIKVEAKTS